MDVTTRLTLRTGGTTTKGPVDHSQGISFRGICRDIGPPTSRRQGLGSEVFRGSIPRHLTLTSAFFMVLGFFQRRQGQREGT